MESNLSSQLFECLQNVQEKTTKEEPQSKYVNERYKNQPPETVHSKCENDTSRFRTNLEERSNAKSRQVLHSRQQRSDAHIQSGYKLERLNFHGKHSSRNPSGRYERSDISVEDAQHTNRLQKHQNTHLQPEGRYKAKSELGNIETNSCPLNAHSLSKVSDNERQNSYCRGTSRYDVDKGQNTYGSTDKNRSDFHRNSVKVGKKTQVSESDKKRDGRKEFLGYKRLMDISEKDSEQIAYILANTHTGFDELLNQKLKPDLIFLVLKILAKLTDTELVEIKSSILYETCRTEFLDQLTQLINSLPVEDKLNINVNEFFSFLLKYYETIIMLLPKTALDRFMKIFRYTEIAIKNLPLYRDIVLDSPLEKHFQHIQKQLEDMKEKEEVKKKKDINIPPNNFRDIDVFPTVVDLLQRKGSFVRPNIVKGAYENVEHYLDVQFRLLREDFIAPLREGINEYVRKASKESNKNIRHVSNVRLYRKVKFKNPKLVTDRVGIAVNFDPDKRIKHIKWEHCKRFMFGALLCFTKDDFKTVILATVVQRELEELKQGIVVVELVSGTNMIQSIFSGYYVMVESEIYFEPYLHVLKGLQKMTEKDFPLERYIVHVDCSEREPAYLTGNNIPVEYEAKIKTLDLNDVLGQEYIDARVRFPVMNYSQWPTATQLGMDETQYKAFQSALTREFVVIQGPPGTGKTFLGLKIVEMLLANSFFWHKQTPILVVCYTNHALDQFLEGLLPMTQRLVRVGGQSESEKLVPFNLREKRRLLRRQRHEDFRYRRYYHKEFQLYNLEKDFQARIESTVRKIKVLQLDMEALSEYLGILSLNTLQPVMSEEQRYSFEQTFQTSLSYPEMGYDPLTHRDAVFADWLLQDEVNTDWWGEEAVDEAPKAEETDMEFEIQLLDAEIKETKGKEAEPMLDLDIDVTLIGLCSQLKYAEDIKRLLEQLNSIQQMIHILQKEEDTNLKYQQLWMHEAQYEYLRKKLCLLKRRLGQLRNVTDIPDEIKQSKEPWQLSLSERWMLYCHWLRELRIKFLEDLKVEDQNYREKIKLYEDLKFQEDLGIMRSALIVGMTTTCAARLQTTLQSLKPSIVIVEEAAEVLESHIVVSLTNSCQHLILIGDHQQLRPTTAVYRLAKFFNFDVSLFERMLSNGMHCHILGVQHRMHPNICKLIVPSIYPVLQNHDSVTLYPPIRGVTKNLFFVTHNYPDEEYGEAISHRNTFEADFVLALCRHLILQGYRADEITVLATYSGQMFLLRKERQKHELLRAVRMTVVDNFQGEENTIILLSLVRSNPEGNVGFLKIDNRVCVALSRARHGMYIVGNMNCLKQASALWQKINDTLAQQEAIGTQLTLQCQVHPDQLLKVGSAKDFNQSPEGGCRKKCAVLLACGHNCRSMCHASNREHQNYKCYEPCNRILCDLDHACKKKCYEECGLCPVPVLRELPCGHKIELQCHLPVHTYKCQVPVKKVLPGCEHGTEAPCHLPPENVKCPFPCVDRLQCGHACRLNCHVNNDPGHLKYICLKPCARSNAKCSERHPCNKLCSEECGDCTITVTKVLPKCGHKLKMKCLEDASTVQCNKPCERTLSCEHPCPKKCGEECGGCRRAVTKIIPECGHKVKIQCYKIPERSMCQQKCERTLRCGHTCKAPCASLCPQCEEMVESKIKAACGHIVKIPCSKQAQDLMPTAEELLSYCRAKCEATLQCKHRCSGNCFDCFQGRIHAECRAKCGRVLICGHSCTTPCATSCPPCKKSCNYHCSHSKCRNKCGEPCYPCTELCEWECAHHSCNKKCFELCDRPPCNIPCKKLLDCGHPCIGFCGETCPPLCRICDEEVTTVTFGHEDEEDARFVYLEDCKHTIESKAMEKWLHSVDVEITLKTCPLCKAPITRTRRYMNILKILYEDIAKAKKLVFGKRTEIANKREEIIQKLRQFEETDAVGHFRRNRPVVYLGRNKGILQESEYFTRLVKKVIDSLREVRNKRKNILNRFDVETLGIQAHILCEIAEEIKKVEAHLTAEWRNKLLKHMDSLLAVLQAREQYLSQQEVDDFNFELKRFRRVTQLCRILSGIHSVVWSPDQTADLKDAKELAFSTQRYTNDDDKRMFQLLTRLKNAVKNIALEITEEERKEIIKAMGLPQGHWFKCPNGHVYAIADCGGAMEVSRCNECGAAIGGQNHLLLQNNQLASEMDGARYAAWSEQANLLNYGGFHF